MPPNTISAALQSDGRTLTITATGPAWNGPSLVRANLAKLSVYCPTSRRRHWVLLPAALPGVTTNGSTATVDVQLDMRIKSSTFETTTPQFTCPAGVITDNSSNVSLAASSQEITNNSGVGITRGNVVGSSFATAEQTTGSGVSWEHLDGALVADTLDENDPQPNPEHDAFVTLADGQTSKGLKLTGMAFPLSSIPTGASPVGYALVLQAYYHTAGDPPTTDPDSGIKISANLVIGGNPAGNPQSCLDALKKYGGDPDLGSGSQAIWWVVAEKDDEGNFVGDWDSGITLANLTQSGTGVAIYVENNTGETATVYVPFAFLIAIWHKAPAVVYAGRSASESSGEAPYQCRIHAAESPVGDNWPHECRYVWEVLDAPEAWSQEWEDPRTGDSHASQMRSVTDYHAPYITFWMDEPHADDSIAVYEIRCKIYDPWGNLIATGATKQYTISSSTRTAVWYSDQGSNQTGNGTEGNPYATLQHAINNSGSGTRCFIGKGSFNFPSTINVPSGNDHLFVSAEWFNGTGACTWINTATAGEVAIMAGSVQKRICFIDIDAHGQGDGSGSAAQAFVNFGPGTSTDVWQDLAFVDCRGRGKFESWSQNGSPVEPMAPAGVLLLRSGMLQDDPPGDGFRRYMLYAEASHICLYGAKSYSNEHQNTEGHLRTGGAQGSYTNDAYRQLHPSSAFSGFVMAGCLIDSVYGASSGAAVRCKSAYAYLIGNRGTSPRAKFGTGNGDDAFNKMFIHRVVEAMRGARASTTSGPPGRSR